jgi:hypothetical protein
MSPIIIPIRLVDFLQELAEVVAGIMAGAARSFCGGNFTPRRIDREIAVLDRRFEDARQQRPRIVTVCHPACCRNLSATNCRRSSLPMSLSRHSRQ